MKVTNDRLPVTDPFFEREGIGKYRRWFREAVDHSQKWQEEAREDFDFVSGRQWSKAEMKRFEETARPALSINRIKPLINLLSGYQRLNRYDVDFLARTPDDTEIAQVRKGITKYVFDRCDYHTEESAVFLDAVIGGLGWFFVGYKYNDEGNDGEAYICREDPFSIYCDPEAHKADLSDAKYICRAKWVDKDELKSVYPEHAEEIDAAYSVYDNAESEVAPYSDELTWYKRELQKVRLVECWYKERQKQTLYILADGTEITQKELTPELFFEGMVVGTKEITVPVVKVCVFFDTVLLEEMDSPYEHGEIPLVPLTCFYYGIGGEEIPAGFVRDLKDPQREINRRRIQQLHILNTTGNGGGWLEEDAMTAKQFAEFEQKGNIPGHFQRVRPMAISQGKIMERQIGQYPAGVAQAEMQATNDLTAISGINEALMGTDIPQAASGRAIELKQRQAATHISWIFDNLRTSKKKIANLLWGTRNRAGVIPQFYTEDKIYRVEGVNGQKFIRVNQQVIEQDPTAGAVVKTLNDLSQGEYDIIVSDIEASITHRQAQLFTLLDAASRLGISGDLIFDIVIDLSEIPHKEEIKQRWQQRQESQAKAAQEQQQFRLELEEIRNRDSRLQISFKDAPLAIQMAMAAKADLIDPAIAKYAVDQMINQMYPQFSEQQAQQQFQMQEQAEMQPQEEQQLSPEEIDKMVALSQMMNNRSRSQNGAALTKPAVESLINGTTPAM